MSRFAIRSVRQTEAGQRHDRAGFTLIEMLIVFVMMGIIAGMAIPRMNFERYRADAALRITRATLQSAQRSAIMRQTNIIIMFDVPQRRMQVLEDANNNYLADAGERITNKPLEEGAKFSTPPAVVGGGGSPSALVGASLLTVSGLPAVAFLRDGAASSDLDIYLTSGRGSTLDFRAVRLTQASGRTEAFRYLGTTWSRTN